MEAFYAAVLPQVLSVYYRCPRHWTVSSCWRRDWASSLHRTPLELPRLRNKNLMLAGYFDFDTVRRQVHLLITFSSGRCFFPSP
jgi:hypothetical protein